MNDPRDILDGLWYDMHDDPRLAREVRTAICAWAGCDDCLVEPNGEVWVSTEAQRINDYQARELVAYLQRCEIIEEPV